MQPFVFAMKRPVSAAFAMLLMTGSALAQVPTSVDPAQVERRFEERLPTAPSVEPAPAQLPAAPPPAAMKDQRFTLRSVAIDGATVYGQEELQPLFAEYLNREISTAEARALAERITLKYRNDGYILSQAVVPKQDIKDGMLRILVVEGYVANVEITGDARDVHTPRLLESYGEKIKQARPLHVSTLERYLLLMDDLPGATAKGVVRPSPTTFGAADLVVTMTHKTLEGSLIVDNRGTDFIGPYQYAATLGANSLFHMYERTLLRGITTTPTQELRFFDIQHENQIGTEGTRLLLTGSYSKTHPGDTLKTLDIDAMSQTYEIRALHPFIRSRTTNLVGRAEFDYRNTDTDILGLPFTNDRLRVLRLGGAYDFADAFRGVNLIDAQASQGLDIFNASESGTQRSRANGESDFTKLNLDITRTQALPVDGLSLLTAVTGQYSFSRLLASEQFAIGGPGIGSAYDPAELAGDHGIGARAELRYGDALEQPFLNSYQAFAYYDIGSVWNRDNTADNNSLASAGLGLRLNVNQWLSGSAEVGFPLTKEVAIENDKDPRFFFSVTGRF